MIDYFLKLSMILLFAFLFLAGCGDSSDNSSNDDDASPDNDDDMQDDDVNDDDAVDDDVAPDPFDVTIFTHNYPDALGNLATGDFYDPAVTYAPIEIDPKYKHVLNFIMDSMMPPWLEPLPTSGPLILYSDDFDTIVFSPLDHFFVSLIQYQNGKIHYGIEGEIDAIPAEYRHRFIMVEGKGINATIEYWGSMLNEDRGRIIPDRYADAGLSYLGFWTDNGAYYYYRTEPGMNEQETMLAVKADADQRKIPYGYLQLDSWWYFKEPKPISPGGLIRWEPQPEMFPDGLTAFHEQLGLPMVAHNRWFALENDYLDDYEFVFDKEMAFPTQRDIFDRFMADADTWGIQTYEQDWLMPQFWGVTYLRDHVEHAEQWMAHIDDAAYDRGLTTQLCMAGAANLMDAVDRRASTTIRTSIDYRLSISKESYWPQFHTVNLIAAAIGLWPFKDNFQSSEKHAEAEALISALSGGMVGPSDRIGQADRELLLRTCREDGLLLKPDRPATPIDAMFLPHQRPFITSTYSQRNEGRWTYLAAYHLARLHPERTWLDIIWTYASYGLRYVGSMFVFPDQVTDWHVDLENDLGRSEKLVAYNWRTGRAVTIQSNLNLPPIEHLYDFDYFILAPIFDNEMALIGETGKFVTMSDKRFTSIKKSPSSIKVELAGVPGEKVELLAYDAEQHSLLPPFIITIEANGTAIGELYR